MDGPAFASWCNGLFLLTDSFHETACSQHFSPGTASCASRSRPLHTALFNIWVCVGWDVRGTTPIPRRDQQVTAELTEEKICQLEGPMEIVLPDVPVSASETFRTCQSRYYPPSTNLAVSHTRICWPLSAWVTSNSYECRLSTDARTYEIVITSRATRLVHATMQWSRRVPCKAVLFGMITAPRVSNLRTSCTWMDASLSSCH